MSLEKPQETGFLTSNEYETLSNVFQKLKNLLLARISPRSTTLLINQVVVKVGEHKIVPFLHHAAEATKCIYLGAHAI